MRHIQVIAVGVLALSGGFAAGCGDNDGSVPAAPVTDPVDPVVDPGDGGSYQPRIDPADFVETIDNDYMPLAPGSRWVYEGESGGEAERIEVEVLTERREVMGVATTVVRDTAYVDGELVEDTYDWFAQDRDGNVWYFGEETAEYEDGEVVSTEGAWEAGVDGAMPGIVMQADPQVGDAYRQEFHEGEAEDLAEVLEVGTTFAIGLGEYQDVLVIEEWNPLEPEVVESKYFAPGVGMIAEVKTAGEEGRAELVAYTPAG